MDVVEAVLDKAAVGKAFKKNAKIVTDAVAKLELNEIDEMENTLNTER